MKKVGNKALIVEGGAKRGAFSCGVLDTFLKLNFSPFDSFWGVSAGASNLAAYLAKMRGRNYKIYTDYTCRSEFLTPFNFLMGKDLIDLDWLWDITIRELGLDIETIEKDKRPFFLTLTRLDNGKPEYHLAKAHSLITTMKASSALPLYYRSGVSIGNERYVDGGVADSIPIREAIDRGASEIMVIRSQAASYKKKSSKYSYVIKKLFRKTPGIIEPLLSRHENYNKSIELIRNPPEGVKIIEICPTEEITVSRFTKNNDLIVHSYKSGIDEGYRAIEKWKNS